jgi:MFS family permease
MLKTIYPDDYAKSSAQANVASITFAGTVLGMLFFGYTSDHFSRKWSLFTSTIIIIVFAALGSGSYGAGGSPTGLLAALVAYRFFLGIGEHLAVQLIWGMKADFSRHRRRISSRQCWLR